MKTFDVFVIGAGPAGLTTAYTLAKAGKSVHVIEQDPTYVGGISRTVDYKGFLFDIGGHRFFSKSKEVVDLWNEILPDDFIDRPRLSRIYYKGKFYAYPLKAFEALRNLGLVESVLCVASYGWARVRPVKAPKTFHEWVRNQFGERLFSIFFKTYTEKVWGMGCDEISADWAAQRIKGLSLMGAVTDGLRRSLKLGKKAASSGEVTKTLIESFRYPRRGPGMMWEAAAAKFTAMGGTIAMGSTLESLAYDEARGIWTIAAINEAGERLSYQARDVVSSAPIQELMGRIAPKPLSVFHARALKYRDFLTVVLIGRPQAELPDNWIYIHDPSVKVGRVQNFRSWSPDMIPDGVSTCLGLEYFCFEGDGLWTSSDEDLVALGKREIEKIGLMAPADVYDACVVRQRKAYPVYDETYAENLDVIRREIGLRYPTLHLVGRNGMHKYNNQDHAMMTGMLTAQNIIAGEKLYDTWQVNEDAEYGEAGLSGVEEALKSERLVPQKIVKKVAGVSLVATEVADSETGTGRLLADLFAYGLVSAVALVCDYGLLVGLSDLGVPYLLASFASFTVGIAVAYGLSARFVFATRRAASRRKELAGFVAVGILGLGLTQVLLYLLVSRLGLAVALAKLPTVGLVFLFNFSCRRAWVFVGRER